MIEYIRKNIFLYIIAAIFALPLLVVASSLFTPLSDNFYHIYNTILPSYAKNSLLIMLGVGFCTFLIGSVCAWIVSIYSFPGRKFFSWALILPLALPAYVAAFVYAGVFEFSGTLQSSLRSFFSWQKGDYFFPEIRSLGGVVFVMSFVFYPYVYMLCQSSFNKNRQMFLVARNFGTSGGKAFFKLAISSARPAYVAGVSLALMEVISDFGAVDYFAVDTFTTGIYRSWFSMGDYDLAAKLSAFLLFFVFFLIISEKISRGKASYEAAGQQMTDRIKLTKHRAFLAFIICTIPLFFGFVLPILQLLVWAYSSYEKVVTPLFWQFFTNSVFVSLISALVAVFIAIIFGYILRLNSSKSVKYTAIFASMGYAVPGSVVAVGVIIILSLIDNYIDGFFNTGLLLSGTMFALVFAYVFRFFTLALNNIEVSLGKVNKEMDWVAKALGASKMKILNRIHLPLITPGILAAFLLVFVESMKELPATLIIRPFNFETLATYTYQLASDERLIDSAPSALLIVVISFIPIIMVCCIFNKKN